MCVVNMKMFDHWLFSNPFAAQFCGAFFVILESNGDVEDSERTT